MPDSRRSPTCPDLTGRVCLITGASRGIGRATAVALAKTGATLVLVCRDPGRGADALAEVRAAGSRDPELLLGDLSVMADVRRVAEAYTDRYTRLDVLINNAGAIFGERRLTPEGLEATLATNHLSYFLLTSLLLDVLQAGAPARIVNVASLAHVRTLRLDLDDLQAGRHYDSVAAYSASKLMNVLFTYELAKRLQGTGVTANCLHPGVVASHFAREGGGRWGWLFRIARPFLITPEQGAATSVYLACSPEVAGVSGRYFDRCRAVASSPTSHDEALAKRLWTISEHLTGLG